ncbi:hypothetical protein OH76DRAFT_1490819 [Lentinus brumalis]|uniref:Uncharacterized protein n=1 Tax=Lentinus brumalis TaxID=2498619 RepID=A0A371CHP8_9APHY|nr:hypothetical protein OH76DRAFT_1490819 [Polyporus brumalis]
MSAPAAIPDHPPSSESHQPYFEDIWSAPDGTQVPAPLTRSPRDPSPDDNQFATVLGDFLMRNRHVQIYLRADTYFMEHGGAIGTVVLLVESPDRARGALTFLLPTINDPTHIPSSRPEGWMRIVHGPRGAELGISHGQRYLLLEIFVIYRAFAAGNHTFQDGDYMNFCRRLLQAAESLGAFEEADQKLRRITAWARRTLPAAIFDEPVVPFGFTMASIRDLNVISVAVERMLSRARTEWLRTRARPGMRRQPEPEPEPESADQAVLREAYYRPPSDDGLVVVVRMFDDDADGDDDIPDLGPL